MRETEFLPKNTLSLSLSLSLSHEKVERIKEIPIEVEKIVCSDTTSYQEKIVEVPYTYTHTYIDRYLHEKIVYSDTNCECGQNY